MQLTTVDRLHATRRQRAAGQIGQGGAGGRTAATQCYPGVIHIATCILVIQHRRQTDVVDLGQCALQLRHVDRVGCL